MRCCLWRELRSSPSESSHHSRLLWFPLLSPRAAVFLFAVQFGRMRGIPQGNAPPRSRTSILGPRREPSRPARRPLVRMGWREQPRAEVASARARRRGLLRPDPRPAAHGCSRGCCAPPRTHREAPRLGAAIGKRCCFLRKAATMERMRLARLTSAELLYLPASGHAQMFNILSVQAHFTHRSQQTRKATNSPKPKCLWNPQQPVAPVTRPVQM